jgi:ribosomal protein S27AE
MDDKVKTSAPACFNCGNTSEQAALFRVLIKNVKQWACARCLPFLIHGPH